MNTNKPKLHFWQIWNMSFGFLGIQFGFGLQNANVSRIFETLGASIDQIPILWLAAPVTGLLIQPIIGYMSDRTWNGLGRRRPYFLAGAIMSSLALIIMPNSPYLWMAAGMLWILDASINVSMEPFRALVADNLPSEQRTQGFAVQTFFIGVGSVIASAMPYVLANWFGIANTAPEGVIPPSVKISFYAGAVVFFGAVLWTVLKTKEYSPEEMERFEGAEPEQDQETREGFAEVWADVKKMPTTMRQLAVVQFFSWFALFAMWIYTTSAVTSSVYGATDTSSALYNEGADWVGLCFAMYNGVSALAAFALPWLAARSSRKVVHALCLTLGGVSLAGMYFINDPKMLMLNMVGIGFAWASILCMPYAILAGSLPSKKMGFFMGVFNFFIVIPQILAAGILGYFTREFFGGDSMMALVLGGASMVVAALVTLTVTDRDDPQLANQDAELNQAQTA
ncbi:MFS transporter [Agarivorans sp. B2Z047]|uniref:Predicted maltose transporter MalT n=1 Tax=Agarivorans albus MKT 106 TaxID=1331007 RepID=R9PGR9_AGAAL|nr:MULTISPECIES: MFS transporter [Agarivorans]MPW31219.1 MFS transporter [Agarivorans sp. B2Z047]UQN42817.1 MFS transporter [Agarivorans sp. B2Z047]GAD00428.1 predicted maltose transporter MalT [Agarivorans albus MKT 106]